MNKNPAPRFPDDLEKELAEYYSAPLPDPAFVSKLEHGLHSKHPEQEQRRMSEKSKKKLAWSMSLALVAMLIGLIVTSPAAVTAMKRMLGYIPGVGLVDSSGPLRVLAVPASQRRDGITLTVAEAVLSADKTVIRFFADPVLSNKLASDASGCKMLAELKLPDGSTLKLTDAQGLSTGYYRFTFEPVPVSTSEATFVLPCIPAALPGALPENWELPLHFGPARAEMTVVPVIELTPSPEAMSENPWTLEKFIETENSYILVTRFSSIGLPPDEKAVNLWTLPKITDASGKEIPFTSASNELELSSTQTEIGIFFESYKIEGKAFDWPLTVASETLAVEHENSQAQFEFDTGPNPHEGQVWKDLNLEFELAGHPLHVFNIIRTADSYQFLFENKDSTLFAGVDVAIANSTQGLKGMDAPGLFGSEAKFAGEIPSGKLIVLVSHPVIVRTGKWQLQWQPENAQALPTPTRAPQACLTVDSWQAALSHPTPIPADLSGKIYFHTIDGDVVIANVANLDGSDRREIERGRYVFPSPDGSLVAHSGDDGLYITDVATGDSRHIPNTVQGDGSPVWSPDGTRLAFGRNAESSLYIINLDGTGLWRIDHGPEIEIFLGWSPDGTALFYSVFNEGGSLLKKVDLGTGDESNVFDAAGTGASFQLLSPDGNQTLFFKNLANSVGGIYISSLDGSNPRLVAQSDVMTEADFDHPIFSPNGKWLLVPIVLDPKNKISGGPSMVLVNPDTCQIIPLSFGGWFPSWIP